MTALYLIYGYREIAFPHRWYVGSCLYRNEQRRHEEHCRHLGHAKKFHRELNKIANGRCFEELVEKHVLEIIADNRKECIERENFHMDRLDSIQHGFNSQHAGFSKLAECWIGKVFTEEHLRNLSKAHKGRKLSEKHKRKIGEAHKGRKRNPETCAKISKGNKNMLGKRYKSAVENTIEFGAKK